MIARTSINELTAAADFSKLINTNAGFTKA